MNRARYFAKRNHGGTWSVIDGADGQIAQIRGVLLVGLGHELAIDMARLLILEDRKDRSEELE